MAKALVSGDSSMRPNDLQFAHFGVMNRGHQGGGAFVTSLVTNLLLAFVVCVIGASAKHTLDENKRVTILTAPVEPLKPAPEIVKPKVVPLPPVPRVEAPKITVPMTKLPDPPKPITVAMTQPAPVLVPAPPKLLTAPAAPREVSFAHPMAASVANNSPHPTAVALGRADNPIAPSDRPAVANAVNLGQRGLAGMPASNTGGGPASTKVNLGSGNGASQMLAGNGTRPVQGIKLGVAGGTGTNNAVGRQIGQVNLGRNDAVPPPVAAPTKVVLQTAPKVLYKPVPAYTAEASALHISGAVSLRIRVNASGAVSVLELTNGLGHGLDESAKVAIQQTRFAPALDSSGHPTDWEGIVRVNFQMVGS